MTDYQEKENKNIYLPININISNKKILIIGAGKVGLHKAKILSRFVDSATIISPFFLEEFDKLPFSKIQKEYQPSDLQGAFLVYVCTENHQLNEQIKHDCQTKNILCSVCDNPSLCDFTSPAIFKDQNIMVAVSSNAKDVRKSMSIRDVIKDNWDYLMGKIKEAKSIYKK